MPEKNPHARTTVSCERGPRPRIGSLYPRVRSSARHVLALRFRRKKPVSSSYPPEIRPLHHFHFTAHRPLVGRSAERSGRLRSPRGRSFRFEKWMWPTHPLLGSPHRQCESRVVSVDRAVDRTREYAAKFACPIASQVEMMLKYSGGNEAA